MPDETQETAMAKSSADVSEAQIAVHWKEEEFYYPTAKFVGQANLTDPSVNERFSIDKFPECFNEYAAMLRDFAGLKTGDRATLHLPMVPELPITMLACARLGVIHSEVFGG